MNGGAAMSEVRAALSNSPELGDVLASIRRLIAQDDQVPDFASLNRRTDGNGAARSTLPLGPRSEMLRSVIEREMHGMAVSDDRLLLGHDVRSIPDQPEQAGPVGPLLPDGVTGQGATITPIIPHTVANAQTETVELETEMVLAEMNRLSLKDDPAMADRNDGFDLFAADATEDDDQLAGGNALRNLVRDVIRQELQGEMGERISRNLRRAVRHEVAAAISAGLKTA